MRRSEWIAVAAVLAVHFGVGPAFGHVRDVVDERPSFGEDVLRFISVLFCLLLGYWFVGGAVRRARRDG